MIPLHMRHYFVPILSLMLIQGASATDRVVDPNGTYNTIGSAIVVSEDGDRILVQQGAYNEYLNISASVSIQPLVKGTRYQVLHGVNIVGANGKSIHLSGMRTTVVSITGTYYQRSELSITDARMDRCDANVPYMRVDLYRDTVASMLIMSSGSAIGCTFGISGSPGFCGIQIFPGSVLQEACEIIGNSFGAPQAECIMGIRTDRPFRLENNFVRMSGASAIEVKRSHIPTGPASTITNNTFYLEFALGQHQIALVDSGFTDMILARNNVTVNWQFLFGPTPPNMLLDAAYNLYGAPSWIDTSTGAPSPGSPLIDAGDPDPRYLDLDLSRNDAGCFGGSNSRTNFLTPLGSSVVGFLRAPRVIAQNQPVSIEVIGFDR